MNKKTLLGLSILLAAFAVIGILVGPADDPAAEGAIDNADASGTDSPGWSDRLKKRLKADSGPGDAPQVRYTRWRHPQGLFSAEVPAGWRIEGQIDPQGLDKGAFMIQGFAPDGRAMFSFAHNWLWFMEYQYGPYRPGHATVETLVAPNLPRNLPQMGLSELRIAYRGKNTPLQLSNPATGLPLRTDQGTLGLLARNGKGEVLAGTLMGETLYMPVPGSPGLWGLRLFSGGIAPASSADQAAIRAIQMRVVDSLELSPEFMQVWQQAHQQTVARMKEYSRQMDQVFERYLSSTRRGNSRGGKDPMEDWAEMMREGHYERDPRTDEEHWVGNNNQYWWKNDQGVITGNNTGQPPADNYNWNPLHR